MKRAETVKKPRSAQSVEQKAGPQTMIFHLGHTAHSIPRGRIVSPSIKKEPKPARTRRGGPCVNIDLEQLQKLAEVHCTQAEIAAFFKIPISTFERLSATPEVGDTLDRGAALGRIRVRRQQFKLLGEGDVRMAIWLGKQILGQRDNPEQSLPVDPAQIEADAADREKAILLSELFDPDEIARAHERLLELERVAAAAKDHGQTMKTH